MPHKRTEKKILVETQGKGKNENAHPHQLAKEVKDLFHQREFYTQNSATPVDAIRFMNSPSGRWLRTGCAASSYQFYEFMTEQCVTIPHTLASRCYVKLLV